MSGDHIRVERLDDRMEIENPGRFPGMADASDTLRVTRFPRNPRIARACADLALGQELGEGIRRMFEEMRLAGLAGPFRHQTEGASGSRCSRHSSTVRSKSDCHAAPVVSHREGGRARQRRRHRRGHWTLTFPGLAAAEVPFGYPASGSMGTAPTRWHQDGAPRGEPVGTPARHHVEQLAGRDIDEARGVQGVVRPSGGLRRFSGRSPLTPGG